MEGTSRGRHSTRRTTPEVTDSNFYICTCYSSMKILWSYWGFFPHFFLLVCPLALNYQYLYLLRNHKNSLISQYPSQINFTNILLILHLRKTTKPHPYQFLKTHKNCPTLKPVFKFRVFKMLLLTDSL